MTAALIDHLTKSEVLFLGYGIGFATATAVALVARWEDRRRAERAKADLARLMTHEWTHHEWKRR